MKLYDFALAPSPRRVRVFLAEKGIEVPTEEVGLRELDQFKGPYKSINPRCEVPLLELDDGTRIGESLAICGYFEAIHPDPPLMGVDAVDRALVTMWERRMELDGLEAVTEVFRNSSPRFAGRAIPGPARVEQQRGLVERGTARVERFFHGLDERLADNEYVAGNSFTIADITAMVSVDFAKWVKLYPNEDQTHLNRWYAQVSARPSAKA